MKKPKPRTKFANETDEQDHILNGVCWMVAERMSLDLGMRVEDCANFLKQKLSEGRLVIDFDEKDNRWRLMPAPSLAIQ
jgi:hypothetical protein